MSLRGDPVIDSATLPEGRRIEVFVGVPDDPYIPKNEMDTVDVELRSGDEVVAAVNTLLGPDDRSEARALAREIVSGLESGELEPTAGALESLAERRR